MPKLNLSQTYIHSGKFYGPGEVEVEDAAVAKDLTAREDDLRARREAQTQQVAAPPAEPEAPAVPRRRGR